jgi:hypothetical protein
LLLNLGIPEMGPSAPNCTTHSHIFIIFVVLQFCNIPIVNFSYDEKTQEKQTSKLLKALKAIIYILKNHFNWPQYVRLDFTVAIWQVLHLHLLDFIIFVALQFCNIPIVNFSYDEKTQETQTAKQLKLLLYRPLIVLSESQSFTCFCFSIVLILAVRKWHQLFKILPQCAILW